MTQRPILKVPCLNCPDRHIRCHSECEKYESYRRTLAEAQQRKIMDTEAEKARREGEFRVLEAKKRGFGKHPKGYYNAKQRGCIDGKQQ